MAARPRPRPRPGGAGRTAAIAIVVVVAGLSAVVLASRGVPSDRTRAAYSASFDDRVLLVGFVSIVVAMTALVIWSAWPDARGPQFDTPRSWWKQYAVSLAVLLLLLVLGAVRAELRADRGTGHEAEGPAAGGVASDPSGGAGWAGPASGTATVALSVVGLAVAAAAVGRRQARRRAEELARRRRTGSADRPADDAEAGRAAFTGMEDEVDEDEVASEPDPRRAVRLAYAVLERRLAGTPFARPAAATPQEWLAVLRRGGGEAATAAGTLTVLYERARFADDGRRPMTLADRDDAVRALRVLRAHLDEPSTSTGGRGL